MSQLVDPRKCKSVEGGAMVEKQTRPLKQADQVAEIVNEIRAKILSGEMGPDTQLKQESIAALHGVSRMPVREALKQLEHLGFVTVNEKRRTFVAPRSIMDLKEIYDMRIAAEVLAIKSALPHLTNAQIDKAASIQAEIERLTPEDFGPLNVRFHTTLYAPASRPRLMAHIQMLGHAADRYSFMQSVEQSFRDKSNDEHHELLEACYQRDEDRAVKCMATHLGDARDTFARMFSSDM